MTRVLSGATRYGFTQRAGALCYLIELAFGSETLRVTTAPANIAWDGHTWLGIGGALVVDVMPETADARAAGVDLTLSGVNQDIVALVLSETYRGRQAKVWLAPLWPGKNLFDNASLDSDATGYSANAASISRDTTVAYTGNASLKVVTTNVGASGTYLQLRAGTRPAAVAGNDYTVSAWVRGDAGSVGKMIQLVPHFYAAGGSQISAPGQTPVALSLEWQRITATVQAPATTASLLLAVYTGSAQGVFNFWVQGMQAEPGNKASETCFTATTPATEGTLVTNPLLPVVGFMNDAWSIQEDWDAGNVVISTRLTSRYAELQQRRGIRCNVAEHRAALRQDAPTGWDTETFFRNTAAVQLKPIYWGGFPPGTYKSWQPLEGTPYGPNGGTHGAPPGGQRPPGSGGIPPGGNTPGQVPGTGTGWGGTNGKSAPPAGSPVGGGGGWGG